MGDENDLNKNLLEESTSSQYIGPVDLFADLYSGEEEIKKKLKWFFKTPYGKYNERGKKPFKLILQVMKIILVTIQAYLFAIDKFSIINFEDNNSETFQNLFIFEYNNNDIKNLYTKESVYGHMFHAWKQYYSFEDIAIGSYNVVKNNGSIQPIYFCKQWNLQVRNLINSNEDFVVIDDNEDKSSCYYLKPPLKSVNESNLKDFILENNFPKAIVWILSMQLSFSFQMNYTILYSNSPDCYEFDVKLLFDNYDLDGIMSLSLDNKINFPRCRQKHRNRISGANKYQTVFESIVLFICIISTSLCIRSFKTHFKLYKDAKKFFQEYRHEQLKFSDKIVFLSYWLVLIVLSDVFAICGSVIKLIIDWLEKPELYGICSICFGLAVLFSWAGILRYLGFLKRYNVLLLTMKFSFPTIVRFICCVMFIYIGFVLCGWIVLGPYHEKFSNLILTSECLYSLLNGDDMFNTFTLVYNTNPLIFYFSKVYLYVFISLFIFVVLSLFIGIVEDTFEKINQTGYAPKTRVELFMEGKEYTEDE